MRKRLEFVKLSMQRSITSISMIVAITFYSILTPGCSAKKNIIPASVFYGAWSLSKLVTGGIRKACNVCPLIIFDSLNIVVSSNDVIIEKYEYKRKGSAIVIKNLDSDSLRSDIFSDGKYYFNYSRVKNTDFVFFIRDRFTKVEIAKELLLVSNE